MIKVKTVDYIGKTVFEMMQIETIKKEYGGLFSQPYMISINGNMVSEKEYDSFVIKEGDKISLIPLYSGG
jgi:sulfur carrier protein ThiS